MADNPRIEELRRRIQKDPASIAFAQLAEEHRRAGQFDEAVRVCRTGLAQHPAYLSARITLGRALFEMARYDEAAIEFEYVLKAAPDNLTANRELSEIQHRRPVATSDVSPEQRRQAAASEANTEPRQRNSEPDPPPSPAPIAAEEPPPPVDLVVAELEAWLAVITEERGARAAGV